MKYIVKVEERLNRIVTIEAENEQEATAIAERLHNESKIILDVSDFDGAVHVTCYGTTYQRPDLARQARQDFDKNMH